VLVCKVVDVVILFIRTMETKSNIVRGIRFGRSWQQQLWVALVIFT